MKATTFCLQYMSIKPNKAKQIRKMVFLLSFISAIALNMLGARACPLWKRWAFVLEKWVYFVGINFSLSSYSFSLS